MNDQPQAPAVDQGTYELLQGRLEARAKALRAKAEALNKTRIEVFGSTELTLASSERIRTENNCVPRDVLAVGDRLLFGYQVFIGLRSETRVEDVLALHRFRVEEDGDASRFTFEPVPADDPANFLADDGFVRDFGETYRYYKDTRLQLLRRVEGRLLAVFQTGADIADIKVFRWAIDRDGAIRYLDNRGERDHVFPPSHDFEWTETGRDDYVLGRHPHVSILDEVFVETVGGDLTVKVEDNTEDGHGIYRESVAEPDQTLADAEIHFAKLGDLILLKVLPYKESDWRYLVFNTRDQNVHRIDAIGQACVQLPEDHGIVFPGGYVLQDGSTKTFALDTANMEFKRVLRSPNGEDVLYVFHQRAEGRYVLLPYNLIRKQVQNPITGHGFGRFDDGYMVIFRADEVEPTRVHPMQVWRTPFLSDELAAKAPVSDSYLATVGNADLVRGISDGLSLVRAAEAKTPTVAGYEELARSATRALDAYPWLGHEAVDDLADEIVGLRDTAEQIIGAFAKVEGEKRRVQAEVEAASEEIATLVRAADPDTWKSIDDYVAALAALRRERGRLVSLREMRYADLPRIEALDDEVKEAFAELSSHTVDFLLGDQALAPYVEAIDEQAAAVDDVAKASELGPRAERIAEIASGLELLTEVVGSLAIDDATVRTRILERISETMAGLNRARAIVDGRRKSLASKEGAAEFAAQFQLLDQHVAGALAVADSPESCDEALAKLMVEIEDLESRFGELDDSFLEQLSTKREDVYEALSSRKQALQDERQRRADRLWSAAERIFSSITRRTAELADGDALNAYFVGDAMVAKLRDIGDDLRAQGAAVRADELESRLKAARQDAGRSLRDRQDLYEEGTDVVRLGRHRFSVNHQPLALTMVPRKRGVPGQGEVTEMAFHLAGTDYFAPVDDPGFADTAPFWDQLLVSESESVYRAEYLAYRMLVDAGSADSGSGRADLDSAIDDGRLEDVVRAFAAERYDEGYERGVHDHDAALILETLLTLSSRAGLLRFPPRARAIAYLFWAVAVPAEQANETGARGGGARGGWHQRARSLGRLRASFAHSPAIDALCAELADRITDFADAEGIALRPGDAARAGSYLFEELARADTSSHAGDLRFVQSAEAVALHDAVLEASGEIGQRRTLRDDIADLGSVGQRFVLAEAWASSFAAKGPLPQAAEGAGVIVEHEDSSEILGAAARAAVSWEAAALLVASSIRDDDAAPPRAEPKPMGATRVEELLGQHPRIRDRALDLRLDGFLERLGAFSAERVPAFRAFQARRHALLEAERARLRLGEFEPRVMSAFVRNRLIDEVYLHLIGDNLAKQIGALGEGKRTDQMGLLLLISPPGYGKTTLMEYVASRLGMTFVKVNGPALGHHVTSVDPAEAPNATARQEVEKISFGLEMGNNVLLYLDDIQHTSPELLQKFISLCDAQRRMEGVWRDRTRTYDLRGKRFAVVMAGNPYTESGETFRIPDMLANRADTYNLGDILSGKEDLFALSYLENALTSNATLAPVAARDPADIGVLVKMARGETIASDALSHAYEAAEREDILAVLRKLLRVQAVLLAINQTYIRSASQADAYRTEPPFLLQGSYRNMNKLTERIVPEMNDSELEALIDDHYLGEAQALTTGAEANLLKLKELRGVLDAEEAKRWDAIKRAFVRQVAVGGDEEDPTVRVIRQIGVVGERLEGIDRTLALASDTRKADGDDDGDAAQAAALVTTLEGTVRPLAESLREGLSESLGAIVSRLAEIPTPRVEAAPKGKKRESAAAKDDAHLVALRSQTQQLTNRLDTLLERLGDVLTTVTRPSVAPPGAGSVSPDPGAAASSGGATSAVSGLEPYLARLDDTLRAFGERPSGIEVVQRLGPGVVDLLDRLGTQVEGAMLPLVQSIGRRLDALDLDDDRGTSDLLDKSLKRLDELKDLVSALRKIDTGRP